MTDETPWWKRLRAIAQLHGDYYQTDIADSLGVSNAAVTGWKQGVLPTWQNILKAARVYNQDAHDLLIAALPEFAPSRSEDFRGMFSSRPAN